MVQIGTAISLAIAATVAHAGGVTADASTEDLIRGYRDCFWLAVGLLGPPIIGCWFLKVGMASQTSVDELDVTANTNGIEKR
jgi:hypothetical protein